MVEDFALGAMLLPDRSFVRNDPLLLKHQLQPPHIIDVLQRIAADDDQIGELARFHRAGVVRSADDRGGMLGCCEQRLLYRRTGTPAAILSRLNTETLRIVQTPELKERLAKLASEPLVGTPEQFAAFQKAEIAKWAKAVQAAGVRLD